ncbi:EQUILIBRATIVE NUCLEOTIDE TRANSPORTER 3-RELATED [Salix purpurea]|uniref:EQUILIBRATIVE NUCLEOTIDE TRANSPORTER 3-RELATED n=1 Tax=Salix purpurea TaxID=77065 RepID=A0A9Q0WHV8_SALPP|nr:EQUILIBRATIVE NUCLEOTIDE TRANSPORTER 3-RELATED [Salix purpurea]KAJ6767230.1 EQUILIBRATIVE NUCLEOTIDE TRANSPORTER 3-RELATED [Salix purpurea]
MKQYSQSEAPRRLEGKHLGMACCWALGLATLVTWNCMLTIEDYYYKLFPNYHPARLLTLIYMPFAVVSMAILTYYESKIDTRKRNLSGLILFFLSSLLLLLSRYIPLVEFLMLKSRKGLMIAVLSRFLLIPAFYFTAKYSDQGWMILLISFLGLTTGYLTVCVVTEAPIGYKGPEQNALGNLLVLCVLCGVFAGVALDWLWLIGKKDF